MGFHLRERQQAARDADAYVELIAPQRESTYTKADYLRIGIASRWMGSFWKRTEAQKNRN